MKFRKGLLVLALAVAGCSSEGGEGSAPGDGTKGDETPAAVGGKDVFDSAGYKADCLDCDLDGPNAFVQLGIGDRFWKVGDAWQVAWLLRADKRVQMSELKFQEPIKADLGFTVLDFEVIELGTTHTGGREVQTATIRITQGEARGNLSQILDGNELRVDKLTRRIDLVLDEFLRPVAVTEYSGPRGAFPNGRTIQADPRAVLRSLDSSFPYVVPNAYLNAEKVSLPELPEKLAAVAAVARPGYETGSYFLFDMKGRGLESAERVYWAPGDLWPFYVELPHAIGVLVAQNK